MCVTTKKKLRETIMGLTYRVMELEERLCPCSQHDWIKIGANYHDAIVKLQCKRCGKTTEKHEWEVD